ncbi:MAG: hypothetical protein JO316_09820 [Abitibacteriaceae bacterium]|nr:hypothetical protein [Abditibacteriaceae bacterium]
MAILDNGYIMGYVTMAFTLYCLIVGGWQKWQERQELQAQAIAQHSVTVEVD